MQFGISYFFYLCHVKHEDIMKNIKILSLLFCLAMLAAACHEEEEGPVVPQPREQVGRTGLVYIVGDNGVNELSDLFKANI